jgi:NAD-dependent SIR2 family protein deacetylase
MFDRFKVTKEQQQFRLRICAVCEHNVVNVCSKCGCVLKLKTQWKGTECPVGRWKKIEEQIDGK